MRLAAAILWGLASLMWLPWAAVAVRFVVDLASGTPFSRSQFLNSALAPVWPRTSWLDWHIVSWVPLFALAAFGLAYAGWRLFWWERDWQRGYSGWLVSLSILVPPVALILLYRDARRRFRQRNAELQAAADEARERLEVSQNPNV